MSCKHADFLGVCEMYQSDTEWTDWHGVCFVEEQPNNTCPNYEYVSQEDIPSAIKTRNK